MGDTAIKENKGFDKVINFGFMNGSIALAKFTKSNAFCGLPVVKHITDSSFDRNTIKAGITSSKSDKYYIVSTDIIGAVSCKTYFILSQEEAEKLSQAVRESSGLDGFPMDEILKESDNILVAGVVTALANNMTSNVFGGVPILREVNGADLCDMINEDLTSLDFDLADFEYYYHVQTKILFPGLAIKPLFFWVLPDELIENMK